MRLAPSIGLMQLDRVPSARRSSGDPLRIAFSIKTLARSGGGAERVLVDVASELAVRGHKVIIVTNDREESTPYYPLHHSIELCRLGIGDTAKVTTLLGAMRQLTVFRRTIKKLKPDIVVSFMHSSYVPMGIALALTGFPLIASEHISSEHYRKRPVELLLMNITPLFVRRITVVSDQIRASFGPWLRRRMLVIPNPVRMTNVACRSREIGVRKERLLLSVGRLEPQKDQKVLISAFAMIAEEFPSWKLRILGEGVLRSALASQIAEAGLAERIELPGATQEISVHYGAADLFVLPSRYESFGLATAEALLHGLAVVGFADCSGTNELIRDRENGRLVVGEDRIASLAKVLRELMSDAAERKRLSEAPRDWLVEKYDIAGVVDQWEDLLHEYCR